MIGAFKCSTLATRCDIEDGEDKKLCIDVLRYGNLKYGEDQCNHLTDESENRQCVKSIVPNLKEDIMNGWCNTNVSSEEFCNSRYDDETEIDACTLISNRNPISGNSCLSYIDESADTIKLTTAQVDEFDNRATNLIDFINQPNSEFIKLFDIGYDSEFIPVIFDISDGYTDAKLLLMLKADANGDSSINAINLHSSNIILDVRPGKKYEAYLSYGTLEKLNNYAK
jgi:hypothetical protein